MDASAYFRGKKITLMGLGILGRGVGDARYLAACGADLIVTDLKSPDELAASLAQLEGFRNITFVLGEHRIKDFKDRDLIVKAAGVPLDSPYIAEAKRNGIPVRMSADLFMELSGVRTVGITGTRGKSTVTHLIARILAEAGERVLMGGNVRGVSTLALLAEATPEHIAVLELDSWQCQGLGEAGLSPQVAVFTTFMDDHANYYKDDPAQYLADKSNIFLYQGPEDVLIAGAQCAPILIEAFGEHIVGEMQVVGESLLPQDWTLRIIGAHNRYNAALALAAARTLGVPDEVSRRTLEAFESVPGRLELVREKDGVRYYNDTTATTPAATLAALAAFNPAHTILIAGGADKLLDTAALVGALSGLKKTVLLSGTGTDRIRGSLAEAEVYGSLEAAFAAACRAASPGDAVVLSPGFASFGLFANEYDRGDQFTALVHAL